jgi:hypothetical protein|nr:MAG TPA: hypothetical protein [Caudoviricetes sp.]
MKTSYFTLGQSHVYRFNGQTLDHDCVIKITAENPRDVMVEHFGLEWSFEYEKCPEIVFFPRGVYNLTESKWERLKHEIMLRKHYSKDFIVEIEAVTEDEAIDIFKKNIEEYKAKSKKQTVLYGETLFVNGTAVVEFENDTNTSN